MIDEDGLAEALEWQGLSQEEQRAYDRAVMSWEEGALICKAFELEDRLRPLLTHLKRGYQALEMPEELEQFDTGVERLKVKLAWSQPAIATKDKSGLSDPGKYLFEKAEKDKKGAKPPSPSGIPIDRSRRLTSSMPSRWACKVPTRLPTP